MELGTGIAVAGVFVGSGIALGLAGSAALYALTDPEFELTTALTILVFVELILLLGFAVLFAL